MLQVEEYHYKDLLSVVYIRAIEELCYRLRSITTRIFCLSCI